MNLAMAKPKDPLEAEWCRDDRCDRGDLHPPHEIKFKRVGRPKKHHSEVVARPPAPHKPKVRGWHKCHVCGGSGVRLYHPCNICEGKGSVFVGYKNDGRGGGQGRQLYYNGKTQGVIAWAKELGIPKITIYKRLKAGATVEEALDTKKRPKGQRK